MSARWLASALSATMLCSAGCATAEPRGPDLTLTGPEWRLLFFRSSDDAIGIVRPGQNEVYTLSFQPNGSLTTQLACNNGTARWTSRDAKKQRGMLSVGPVASTMKGCLEGDLARFPADISRVRSFVIADGRLNLNLVADAGDYVFVPAGAAPPRTARFACDDGRTLTVSFMDGSARVIDGSGLDVRLPQAPAASGFSYETPRHAIRGKGDALTLTIGRMVPIQCKAVS